MLNDIVGTRHVLGEKGTRVTRNGIDLELAIAIAITKALKTNRPINNG